MSLVGKLAQLGIIAEAGAPIVFQNGVTNGAVTSGTVAASKAVVVDANKDIGDFRNLDAVNVDAGASGTAGSIDVFPGTASKGKLAITCTDQTGNTTVTLKPAAMGQATQVNIPDPGAAASYLVQSTTAMTLAQADVLLGVTAGTITASKAVVVDSNKDIGEFRRINRTSQQYVVSLGNNKVGGTAGWVVAGTDNLALATLPASQSAAKLVIPIKIPLKVGWTITAFSLVGQIESAGGAVTLDADLRKHTAAAADVADASVGAITQVSVTADAIVSASKTGLTEVVAADETFYILVTGTTAGSTDIALQGYTLTVTEI